MCVGGIASRKRALNLKQQQLWPCANHATFVINREKHCNSADLTDLHIHLQHLQGTSGCDQEYYVLHALDIPVFIHKAKGEQVEKGLIDSYMVNILSYKNHQGSGCLEVQVYSRSLHSVIFPLNTSVSVKVTSS